MKSDERILGDGDFVAEILSKTKESFERCYALKAGGVDVPVSADDPGAQENYEAWKVLSKFEKPFITMFSDSDLITHGGGTRIPKTDSRGKRSEPCCHQGWRAFSPGRLRGRIFKNDR